MKLGWIAAPASAAHPLDLIADSYLSVSAPIQYAAIEWLATRASFQQRTLERTRANLAFLRASGAEVLRAEGGWYAVLRLPATRAEEEWMLAFLDAGVLVQPGFFYDFESEPWAVVSLITPPETFQKGVEILVACQNRFA
jgi:aspartate/methionine/tyrosine aminotransferase